VTTDQTIRILAASLLGWAYPPPCPKGDRAAWDKAHPVRVPRELASPLMPPVLLWDPGEGKWINCSPMTGALLGAAFPKAWQPQDWAALQVLPSNPWSPIDVAVLRGVGSYVNEPLPNRWHLVQQWSGLVNGQIAPGCSGHAVLQYGLDRQLQATTWVDLDGDGKRTDTGRVTWTEYPWVDFAKRHTENRLCVLREAA
jgi:hypothetical protein